MNLKWEDDRTKWCPRCFWDVVLFLVFLLILDEGCLCFCFLGGLGGIKCGGWLVPGPGFDEQRIDQMRLRLKFCLSNFPSLKLTLHPSKSMEVGSDDIPFGVRVCLFSEANC